MEDFRTINQVITDFKKQGFSVYQSKSQKNILKVEKDGKTTVYRVMWGESPDIIDWSSVKFMHKRDGWIVSAFKYNGKIYFKTNSVFVTRQKPGAPLDCLIPDHPELKNISDIIIRALANDGSKGFIDDEVLTCNDDWCKNIPDGTTICMELESPWNVIHTHIVNDAKLWLIMFRNPDGTEVDVSQAKTQYEIPFEVPKYFNFKDTTEMLSTLNEWETDKDGEGIVAVDSNFNRVKVKCEDYLRVKYACKSDEFTDKKLMGYVLRGEADDLIAINPNIQKRVDNLKQILQSSQNKLKDIISLAENLKSESNTKKDFAQKVKQVNGLSIMYKVWDTDGDTAIKFFWDTVTSKTDPMTAIQSLLEWE